MLVVEKARALALNLANPARVMALIPTAKQMAVPGAGIVVVPHRMDEVRVLRNIGIKAPAPILHYYDWPGRLTPYEHQKATAGFLTLHPRCMVLNEIGTGKTASALWAADYLIAAKAAKRVLILSPLSTLESVWGDTIFKDFYHRKHVTLYGSAQKRLKLLQSKADFFIVNHDGFGIIADEASGMFDVVIVDESAVLRNANTTRTRIFRGWMEKNLSTRLWLMTGTPTPNAPTDAWVPARLMNNPYIPTSRTSFRDMVMYKIGMHTWLPKPEAMGIVQQVLQPSVRYTRDECFDLPDTIFQTRTVDMTAEQKKYYVQMFRKLVAAASTGEDITAVNEAVKMQKLVQIACGVAYDDAGNHVELDCTPRVEAVKEIIEEAGEKVIVFVPLTGTLNLLHRELSKHWSTAVVNGAVKPKDRHKIFKDFQEADDPRVLIAHPATMSHGLTLTAAATIIWYGPINSTEQYIQANGRIERVGKRHVSNVVNIEAAPIERKIYKRLKDKQTLQGVLLELIKENTEV